MKLLVSGTRHADIADHGLMVRNAILHATDGEAPELYVGDEPDGIDAIAAGLARTEGWPTPHIFEAQWDECGPGCPATPHRMRRRKTGEAYCRFSGPRRNGRMIRAFKRDGGQRSLFFPAANAPSPGTTNCLKQARKAGLVVPDDHIIALTVEAKRRG
jgi:hypothetical protein